jgi:hypothetical protein
MSLSELNLRSLLCSRHSPPIKDPASCSSLPDSGKQLFNGGLFLERIRTRQINGLELEPYFARSSEDYLVPCSGLSHRLSRDRLLLLTVRAERDLGFSSRYLSF